MAIRSVTGWWGVVLDAPDARSLAGFYGRLLGWRVADAEPDWATVAPPDGVAYLGFQTSPGYRAPAWPSVDPEHQQMMMHLDVGVSDLDGAVADALQLGAVLAAHQPQERVRVLLDPAGHPFCLYLDTDPPPATVEP